MKRFLLKLLTFVLVAALAAFLLAPVAVRQYRLWENAKVVDSYRDATNRLSPSECDALRDEAQAHNQALDGVSWTDPYAPSADGGGEDYAALLNPAGNDAMAVLEVPKLGLSLAVYHGGEPGAATARVEHVPQSRLPSGSAGGPCLLRAARERFFNPFAGLDRLIVGDCFFLRVLEEIQTYEVFQVATVTPEALEDFQSAEGDNECALVAGIAGDGDRRLVVRGRRVSRQSVMPADDSRPLPGGVPELIFAAPVAIVGLALLAVIEGLRRIARRRMRRRMKL